MNFLKLSANTITSSKQGYVFGLGVAEAGITDKRFENYSATLKYKTSNSFFSIFKQKFCQLIN
jgi:hypothetical protein